MSTNGGNNAADGGFFGSFQSAFGALSLVSASSAMPVAQSASDNASAALHTANAPLTSSSTGAATEQQQRPPSASASWSPAEEKLGNSFIKALQPGGILERAALFRRPFNAVLVPRQCQLEALAIADLLETKPNPHYAFDESAPPASARAQLITDGDGLFDPSLVLRIAHEDAKCREFLALFLEHHLALFDAGGLSPAFSLACGIRGSLTEMLDKISISGRVEPIPIVGQMPPSAEGSHDLDASSSASSLAPASTEADYLNIFFIEDTAMEAYDLKKYVSQMHAARRQRQQQLEDALARAAANKNSNGGDAPTGGGAPQQSLHSPTNTGSAPSAPINNKAGALTRTASNATAAVTKKAPAAPSSSASTGLGRFISDLFGTSTKAISSTAPTDAAADAQATQSAFQRFQQKMQRPESRNLARSVTAFIEYCNGTSTLSSAAAVVGGDGTAHQQLGVANKTRAVSGREVKSVVDQLLQLTRSIREWDGAEELAIEGFEKYIMTKIYARAFCYTEEEKTEARRFENRLAAFAPLVSEETFEIVPNLADRAQWRQAAVELAAMGDYKCPRDKLVCGTNACRLLIRALELATKLRDQQQRMATGLSSPTEADGSGGGATSGPSSVGTADVFLPALFLCLAKANPPLFIANVKYIDKYRHRSLLDNEAGYLLTCLMSAAEFWQNATHDQLGLSEAVFAEGLRAERALNEREDWAAVAASQPALAPKAPRPTVGGAAAAGGPPQAPPAAAMKRILSQQSMALASPPQAGSAEGSMPSIHAASASFVQSNPSPAPSKGPHADPFDTFFSPNEQQTLGSGKKATDVSSPLSIPIPSLPQVSTDVVNPPSTARGIEDEAARSVQQQQSQQHGRTSSVFASPLSSPPTTADGNADNGGAAVETRPRSSTTNSALGPIVTSPFSPTGGASAGPSAAAMATSASLVLEKAFAKLEANNGSIDTLTVFELQLVAAEALRLRRREQQQEDEGSP